VATPCSGAWSSYVVHAIVVVFAACVVPGQ